MHKGKQHRNYLMLLIVILFISFIFNILVCINNERYSHRVGVNSCKNIEGIKVSNDKIYDILDKSIEVEEISNKELLTLYKNYGDISEYIIELWDDYNFYKGNDVNKIKEKKIDTSSILQNEVYSRIEVYLENSLGYMMSNENDELNLEGKDMEDFKVMKNLSMDMKKLYNDFNEESLKGLEGAEKEKEVINNKYWIDMLNKLNQISEKYTDYDFTKDAVDTATNKIS